MTEIATFFWWWLPTAAIAGALVGRFPSAAHRWSIALAAWIAATGAIGTLALSVGLTLSTVRILGIVVILGAAAVRIWQRNQAQNLSSNFLNFDAKSAHFAPQVFTLAAFGALLLVAGTLLWNVLAASAGSAEFFAYSASARSAVLEGGASQNLFNGALHSLLAERVVAFPTAVQYVTAAISGKWSLWPAKLPYLLIWLAALSLALVRLQEMRLPLAGSALVLLLVLLIPSLVTLVGRGSDFAWIAACALAAASGWLAPRRSGVALAFSALGFLWNPWLGWPLALTSAALMIAISLPLRWRNVCVHLFLGIVFIFMMLLLQRETFLPQVVNRWFQSASESPLWGQHGRWQAAALAACGVAIFALLLGSTRSRSNLALKWYFGFALLAIIASLRTMPAVLGVTDSGFDLALTLFAPALLMVSLSAFGQHVFALSDYRPGMQPEVAAEVVQPSVDEVSPQPMLDHEQMRDKLMLAYNQFGAGNAYEASALANEVLASDPNHPDAHHLLALVALQENRPGDALRAVQRAIDVFPEHALFFLTVADIYGKQERWAEQAEALATASKLDPADMSIKTKLVIAKRKALLAQAQAQAKQNEAGSTTGGGYEIQIASPSKSREGQ